MRKKNEKGFALVLSLVLLMAMSLMGGALIVISASDHQSNNISDEYQQTFYVAETALFEGEKYLLNQYKGPYKNDGTRDLSKRGLEKRNELNKAKNYIYEIYNDNNNFKLTNDKFNKININNSNELIYKLINDEK